jgi:hypothetical protein
MNKNKNENTFYFLFLYYMLKAYKNSLYMYSIFDKNQKFYMMDIKFIKKVRKKDGYSEAEARKQKENEWVK